MLENLKNIITFKYIDKYINDCNYDLALEKLNYLAKEEFMPNETFLKRGKLCHKLLMLEDAYSDFTYVINHCTKKENAYYERMKLNYEISNYYETISDANKLLENNYGESECQTYKFLSYVFINQPDLAVEYLLQLFDNNKYKLIQFVLNESAKQIAADELSKALKLLNVIEIADPDNPIKIFNEAKIYELGGDSQQEHELMKKLDSAFPKYFISHFRFTDMYQERDILEVCFLLELKIFDKQNCFSYPMCILEGYKKYMEGHIIEAKEAFERAVEINPNKPEGYVLLAQTYQLMSGYKNPEYKINAEENYKKAMNIYQKENLIAKAENMKRQIKHLNSTLNFG